MKDIKADVSRYKNSTPSLVKEPAMERAIRDAIKAFAVPHVHPIHLNDVLHMPMDTDSSNPGLPWNLKRFRNKKQVRKNPECRKSIRWYAHNIKTEKPVPLTDCCAFLRAHLCEKGESKTRAVWGFPYTISAIESMFALPLIRAYKENETPIAYGYEIGKGGLRRIANILHGEHYVAIDFKSFDKTIPSWLIRVAFDVLATNLDFSLYEGTGIPHADGLYRLWTFIVEYFIHTPIRFCDGTRVTKHSGVASGSYFTQLVDSIINFIVLKYVSYKLHFQIAGIKVLGDDSIFGCDAFVSLDDVQNIVQELGMSINFRKSQVQRYLTGMTFLGFIYQSGLPHKSTHEWFSLLQCPERPDKSRDHFLTRALGLLYANCGVDVSVDLTLRSLLTNDFKFEPSRSLRRHLDSLGIEYSARIPTRPELLKLVA